MVLGGRWYWEGGVIGREAVLGGRRYCGIGRGGIAVLGGALLGGATVY